MLRRTLRASRWFVSLAMASLMPGCLPPYDDLLPAGSGEMGPVDAGPTLDGAASETCSTNNFYCLSTFTWGPTGPTANDANGTSFPSGVRAHFAGADDPSCLSGPSDSNGVVHLPVPPSLRAGGVKAFIELSGTINGPPTAPVLPETSGPALTPTAFCSPSSLSPSRLTHVILDQAGGIRDSVAKELAITLGGAAPTHGWIYGVLRDEMAMFYPVVVTVVATPAGIAPTDCAVHYTKEMKLGVTGTSTDFIEMTATSSATSGLFVVTCKLPTTMPASAFEGQLVTLHGVSNDSTASFSDIQMPLAVAGSTFSEWTSN